MFPSNVGGVEPSDGSIGTDVFYHKSSHSGSFSVTTPGLLYNTKARGRQLLVPGLVFSRILRVVRVAG